MLRQRGTFWKKEEGQHRSALGGMPLGLTIMTHMYKVPQLNPLFYMLR